MVLDALKMPKIPFKDVPTALNFALDLEINSTTELTRLHEIAQQNNDLITMDLITSVFLKEQVASVQLLRNMIAQLKSANCDPIIQQLMNQQLHRKFATKCLEGLKKMTSDSATV